MFLQVREQGGIFAFDNDHWSQGLSRVVETSRGGGVIMPVDAMRVARAAVGYRARSVEPGVVRCSFV
jgi:hypothetical protein